jgi:hypothetical protein
MKRKNKRYIVFDLGSSKTTVFYLCTLENKKSIRLFLEKLGLLNIKPDLTGLCSSERKKVKEIVGDGKEFHYILKMEYDVAVQEFIKKFPRYLFEVENILK